jgi:TonB family protein
MRAVICLVLLLIASQSTVAKKPQPSATPVELTRADAARLSAYTPRPEYPLAARQRHITGSGIFRLQVQFQTGRVSAVQVERSTGHAILDAAATDTLRRWRLKPDVMRSYRDPHDPSAPLVVRVPITFWR